jgi:hypothetical protein
MTDAAPLDVVGEGIANLIDAFFTAVRASTDLHDQEARSAELVYELDQVVSTYLDEQGLSTDAYQLIQQDVLNTIAHDLISFQDSLDDFDVSFDAQGNADPSAVVAAMDQHFDQLFIDETFSAPLDPGYG